METVPATLSDITPRWLAGALRAGGHLPRGSVSAVAVDQIGADRGFTGVVARARPTYDGVDTSPSSPGARPPDSLVVKLPTAEQRTPSAYRRAHRGDPEAARRHYERCAREVACYRELAGCGAAMPVCYHAVADPELMRVVLLLEDLDGQPGDKLAGCTPGQTHATLRAVAPLHATWWRREAPAWLPPLVTDPQDGHQRYAARLDPFLRRYGHQLTAPVRELLHRLRDTYAAVLAELSAAPATVIHAETHLDNVMFFDKGGATGPAVLLDWQSARRGPAAFDVAEVVFGSLTPSDRRRTEDDLFDRHAVLLAHYGVKEYPAQQLRHHCRLALMCHVAGMVGWLAVADPDQASFRERALFSAAFGDGRLIAALQDHWLKGAIASDELPSRSPGRWRR